MTLLTFRPIFDHHSHVSLYAALKGCPSLAACADVPAALRLLRSLPDDRMNLVLGWHSGRLPLGARDLEGLPPVLLVNSSLHGLRLSPAAAIWLQESDPELVARHADPEWSERNLGRLLGLYGRAAELTPEKLEAFLQELEALGIGAIEDLLLTGEGAWRVIRASRWGSRMPLWTTPDIYRELPPEAQVEVVGLKFFTDGALGARTAALSEPFHDGAPGLLLYSNPALQEALAAVQPLGKPVALHAIGDRAIGQVLDALENLERAGLRFPAIRLEHVQFIDARQARRARDLGATLSMQPNFTSDSVDYADRLSPAWLAHNNPFRMLIDQIGFRPGVDLIFGSDGMPHGLEYAAAWSLFPPFPGQRLSWEELLAGHGPHPDAVGRHALSVGPEREDTRLVGFEP